MTGPIYYLSGQSTVCSICAIPLPLETSRTDEEGRGVHEECYVRKTISSFKTAGVVRLTGNWFSSILVRLQRRLGATNNC